MTNAPYFVYYESEQLFSTDFLHAIQNFIDLYNMPFNISCYSQVSLFLISIFLFEAICVLPWPVDLGVISLSGILCCGINDEVFGNFIFPVAKFLFMFGALSVLSSPLESS